MRGKVGFGKKILDQALFRIYADTSSSIVIKMESDDEGYVAFQLPLQKSYTLKISKVGFVTKIVTVDAHLPKASETGDYYFEFGVDLFEEIQGLDVSVLKNPIAKIFFNSFTKKYDYDYNYTVKINSDIKKLYSEYEQLKKQAKKNSKNKKEEIKTQLTSDSSNTARINSKTKNIPGVTFSVELLSTSGPVKNTSSLFKGIVNVKEYQDGTTYKYYVGEYPLLIDAEKMKQNIVAHFPDASIIAFKDGKKISADEAITLMEK